MHGPQLCADFVFQYPAKKHPMHQPMYDILAGPPLLPTSFVRTLDHSVGPQLFAGVVFINLDKQIIHTWNPVQIPIVKTQHFRLPGPTPAVKAQHFRLPGPTPATKNTALS